MPAVWTGTISFGLVSIPVRLTPAIQDRDIHFRTLHRECLTPIRYLKWCPTCERETSPDELVAGYEYRRGEYLPVEFAELEELSGTHERSVELINFVQLREIDPVYFERTYFIEPAEGGSKPYALLQRALEESGRIGIGRFTLRDKERLVAIRVYRDVLALNTLFYPDEVRAAPARPTASLSDRELQIALSLIDHLTEPFVPERYASEYRQKVEKLLQEKLQGMPAKEHAAVAGPARGQVIDLMEALERSLAAARAARQSQGQGGQPNNGTPAAGSNPGDSTPNPPKAGRRRRASADALANGRLT
ncbi:MAG: Ku protein [Limnochordales bacterium]|nr:Ku protein [Limnochordales bacterium]